MAELKPQVLLTGATGFIGGRLLQALTEEGFHVRVLVRSKGRLRSPLDNNPMVEVFEGDLLKRESILSAMDGTDAAFYLVHSMGGRNLSEIKSDVGSPPACFFRLCLYSVSLSAFGPLP